MRILIITNHFFPEEFKINALADELHKRGHRVTVLTAIPDYPLGHYFKGYGLFSKRIEKKDGIKIFRSFVIPRGSGGKMRMMLNYASLTLSQFFNSLLLSVFCKFDKVFVYEVSPVMVGIPGVIIKKLRKTPMVFWVTDLWPESLSAAGGINNPKLLSVFTSLVKWLYKNSDKILISSEAYRGSICEKGDFSSKIVYYPNWIDVISDTPIDVELPSLPKGFVVLFAGNIGEAQDFDHILESVSLISDKDIHFVFLGNGRKLDWVREYVGQNGLEDRVHLLGRYPQKTMPYFFERADALLLALKDDPIFNITVPSKIPSYMASRKPIIAMLNGEGARIISQARCGYTVPAGDSKALAEVIVKMKNMEKQELITMGENGERYCAHHFDFNCCVNNLEKIFDSL